MTYFNILKENLNDNFPLDLINLIKKYICDCPNILCNFCNRKFSKCYLNYCISCRNRTCGENNCKKFQVDYLIIYSNIDERFKCCHKCINCKIIN